ncbi:hypothetical protein [Secundilactobacillus odoratitofui]|nr:hypothetical protein [Secundilactobacillus odoratitofui]
MPSIEMAYQRMVTSASIPIKVTKNSHYATLLGGCALVTREVLEMEDFQLNFAAQEAL